MLIFSKSRMSHMYGWTPFEPWSVKDSRLADGPIGHPYLKRYTFVKRVERRLPKAESASFSSTTNISIGFTCFSKNSVCLIRGKDEADR